MRYPKMIIIHNYLFLKKNFEKLNRMTTLKIKFRKKKKSQNQNRKRK